eukprot:scaffold64901_cov34-Phaeocystis_antarctica.AAC.1
MWTLFRAWWSLRRVTACSRRQAGSLASNLFRAWVGASGLGLGRGPRTGLRCGGLPQTCNRGPDLGGLGAFVHRVHDCFLVAISSGQAPGAEGLVSFPLDRALKVPVVHGHTQVMALLLREGPVRERAGDLANAFEPLRL